MVVQPPVADEAPPHESPESQPESSAPVTGEPAIDVATAGAADLSAYPVSDHHTHLTRVHEALDAALHPEPATASGPGQGTPGPPRPGFPRR